MTIKLCRVMAAVLSVGGGAAPAQAACTSINGSPYNQGSTFNQNQIPNGWGGTVATASQGAGVPAGMFSPTTSSRRGAGHCH